ncbi:MAG: hypothetical protein ABH879_01335 [archaeon]
MITVAHHNSALNESGQTNFSPNNWLELDEILSKAGTITHAQADALLFKGHGQLTLFTPYILYRYDKPDPRILETDEPVFYTSLEEALAHSRPVEEIGGDINPFVPLDFDEVVRFLNDRDFGKIINVGLPEEPNEGEDWDTLDWLIALGKEPKSLLYTTIPILKFYSVDALSELSAHILELPEDNPLRGVDISEIMASLKDVRPFLNREVIEMALSEGNPIFFPDGKALQAYIRASNMKWYQESTRGSKVRPIATFPMERGFGQELTSSMLVREGPHSNIKFILGMHTGPKPVGSPEFAEAVRYFVNRAYYDEVHPTRIARVTDVEQGRVRYEHVGSKPFAVDLYRYVTAANYRRYDLLEAVEQRALEIEERLRIEDERIDSLFRDAVDQSVRFSRSVMTRPDNKKGREAQQEYDRNLGLIKTKKDETLRKLHESVLEQSGVSEEIVGDYGANRHALDVMRRYGIDDARFMNHYSCSVGLLKTALLPDFGGPQTDRYTRNFIVDGCLLNVAGDVVVDHDIEPDWDYWRDIEVVSDNPEAFKADIERRDKRRHEQQGNRFHTIIVDPDRLDWDLPKDIVKLVDAYGNNFSRARADELKERYAKGLGIDTQNPEWELAQLVAGYETHCSIARLVLTEKAQKASSYNEMVNRMIEAAYHFKMACNAAGTSTDLPEDQLTLAGYFQQRSMIGGGSFGQSFANANGWIQYRYLNDLVSTIDMIPDETDRFRAVGHTFFEPGKDPVKTGETVLPQIRRDLQQFRSIYGPLDNHA